jgi:DNA-binding SARP family transcriptional activator
VTYLGQEVSHSFAPKIGGLLGYLACFLHRSHPRDVLVELFWPDVELESGRTSLRSALPVLRRRLEPPDVPPGSVLVSDRQNVRLSPEWVSTDVVEFERDLQGAKRASPGEAIGLWERAVARYGGELLPGYYEPWVLAERERLAAAYAGALRQLAAARAQEGDLPGAMSDHVAGTAGRAGCGSRTDAAGGAAPWGGSEPAHRGGSSAAGRPATRIRA